MSPSHAVRLSLNEFVVRTESGVSTSPLNVELLDSEFLLIVGPRGSGKSIIFEALAGYRRPGTVVQGTTTGANILVPQDSRLAALPTDSVWSILGLTRRAFLIRKIFGFRKIGGERESRASDLLDRLGLRLSRIFDRPLSSLSGGERKRLLCVAALIDQPRTLLIDGWDDFGDPLIRKDLVRLLEDQRRAGMALIVTTRTFPALDLAPSRALELATLATHPQPQSQSLARSTDPCEETPLLLVENLIVEKRKFDWRRGGRSTAYPVDGAQLQLRTGEALVILGPSGCGKTSLMYAIAGLHASTAGSIMLRGQNVTHARGRRARTLRRHVQMVFQDAAAILEASRTVRDHLKEAVAIGRGRQLDLERMLERLGLPKTLLDAPVDQLSASESQRLDLARSLIIKPKLVLWDAPEVSGAESDGAFLAQVLREEQAEGRSFLIATQNPQIAKALGDRVAMMYAGRIIEQGQTASVLSQPRHPITAAYLQGCGLSFSDPYAPAPGCPHVKSCPNRQLPLCEASEPRLTTIRQAANVDISAHQVACFVPLGSPLESAPAPPGLVIPEQDS